MRVTLIGPVYPYRGGIAHYTSLLAQKLIDSGHEIQVLSFRRQYPKWLYPGASDRDPSTPSSANFPVEYVLDPLYPWTWWQALRNIQAFEPQRVVIQWWTTFWAPAFLSLSRMLRKRSVPVTYLIHNALPHEEKLGDRWLTRLALSAGTGFITQTEREKERLQGVLANAQVSVCPFPIYPNFGDETIPKAEALDTLGLPPDRKILLFFGIVRPYKGLEILLKALGIVVREQADFQLVIAGEFWEDVQKYKRLIDELSLSAHVRIINRYLPNEEAHLVFCGADILIAPYVGGSQSAVASLACGYGLPMIVSHMAAEGIADQDPGRIMVVPTSDVPALAEAIIQFCKQPEQIIERYPDDHWQKLITTIEEQKSDRV